MPPGREEDLGAETPTVLLRVFSYPSSGPQRVQKRNEWSLVHPSVESVLHRDESASCCAIQSCSGGGGWQYQRPCVWGCGEGTWAGTSRVRRERGPGGFAGCLQGRASPGELQPSRGPSSSRNDYPQCRNDAPNLTLACCGAWG